mgnify:CR=1 FL=1
MEDKDLQMQDIENQENQDATLPETQVQDNDATATNAIDEVSPELSEDQKAYKEFVDSLPAKWYALHTFSGYENVAKENLETVVEKFNLQDRIFDIVIPMEDVVEEKNGKKRLVQRKAMPCYILVKIKYADDLWHNITRTRGITGFVGPNGRPLPLTDDDIIRLRLEKIKVDVDLKVGDKVEIIDGVLAGQIGTVTAIDTETGHVSVNVELFNRETSVDVEMSQVRKANI